MVVSSFTLALFISTEADAKVAIIAIKTKNFIFLLHYIKVMDVL
jgi:hypothetical protein